MDDIDRIDGIAGTLLSATAYFSALILTLKRKGSLTDQEEREMYEIALLMLETSQGDDPATNQIYELARDVIETQLEDQP